MHEQNKNKTRAAIALALCFCVMALTSFFAVKSSMNKISGMNASASKTDQQTTEQQEAAVQTPVVDSNKENSGDTQNTGDTPEGKTDTPKYIPPLNGSVQLKYSMDSLVYSKTLDQYMTHPGIDITAKLSSEVKAIADGTVSKVYTDDRYGVTVCITHENGITSVYSNLAQQGLAETGDDVKQNQVIGCVGDTALFESIEESHLHFEIKKDGNCTDPGEYIEDYKQ